MLRNWLSQGSFGKPYFLGTKRWLGRTCMALYDWLNEWHNFTYLNGYCMKLLRPYLQYRQRSFRMLGKITTVAVRRDMYCTKSYYSSIGYIVYCHLECKLRYLRNLKLFSIRVKELFKPTVLQRKADGFLLFSKSFSWETDLWVTLGDFPVKNTKLGLEICI